MSKNLLNIYIKILNKIIPIIEHSYDVTNCISNILTNDPKSMFKKKVKICKTLYVILKMNLIIINY